LWPPPFADIENARSSLWCAASREADSSAGSPQSTKGVSFFRRDGYQGWQNHKKKLSFAVRREFFCEVPGFAPFASIDPKFFWRTGGGDLV
jgi:hypothetical protein